MSTYTIREPAAIRWATSWVLSAVGIPVVPIGPLAIHAQMAERAGFGAFQISGAMAAWWLNGLPDAGIVPRTEIIENARRAVQAVDIPIYCDADTGYGGVQNVRRTVHDFVHAGVAGIHIEDQVEPKKAGSQAGVAVVSDAEAIGRLNAACDARDELDPDFVVVGRTDAYSASGGDISEAIRRAKLYRERTGVDAIMIEAVRTWDEARRVTVPEYQCRFRWTKNAVGMWDNRAVQHYACYDYAGQERVLQGIFFLSEKPWPGVD